MEINSIKDLIDLLKDIGEPKSGYSRFFRGHANQEWKIEPSIYRVPEKVDGKPQGKSFIENENNIIRDAIVNSPDNFSDQDSIFSILVKLQHYGYPTRLLDLTTNALVSLYFAVKPFDNKDGELFVFDIPNSEIKYFDSDTVSILSALSLRKINFSIDLYKKVAKLEEFFYRSTELYNETNKLYANNRDKNVFALFYKPYQEALQDAYRNLDITSDADLQLLENRLISNAEKFFSKEFISQLREFAHKEYIKEFNNQLEISRLLHDIRKNKPSFLPVIESKDLERVICVKPKLDNNRIIRQQGCFLLFGINNFKKEKAILNEYWIRRDKDRIIIPKESKQAILDELKIFGISEKTLFPELESQAREILDKYR